MSAWIEMIEQLKGSLETAVALYMSAWIEIHMSILQVEMETVSHSI